LDSDSIVGLAAVVLLFGGGTLFLLSISPVGKAFAARILGKKGAAEASDGTTEEVRQLRGEVEELRHFGERGLSRAPGGQAARGGAAPASEVMYA